MSQTNSTCYDGDVDCEVSLSASLIVTNTNTNTNAPGKYARFWRRCLVVGFFISLKKTPRDHNVSLSLRSPSVSSDQLPRTSSSQSWHAMDIRSDNEEVDIRSASVLDSDMLTGIQDSILGSNAVPAKGFLHYFLDGQNICAIFLLFICAILSFAVEMIEEGAHHGWHDGVAIIIATLFLVTSRSVSNFLREKEVKKKNKSEVEVTRNGELQRIRVSDIAQGDLLHLKIGDKVPADGLFVNGNDLVLDQVVNSRIDHDTNPFICSGSKVIQGHGQMLVKAVDTSKVYGDPTKRTLLQEKIERLDHFIDNVGLLVSVLIAVIVFVGLLCKRQHKNDHVLPELKGNVSIDVLMKILESMFWRPRGRVCVLTGFLTAIVIGMQHGMPFAITVSLSYWNEKVKTYGVNPQNLSACGAMGLVTVICIDATGGLICNQMEVNEFFIGREDMYNNDLDSEIPQVVLEALHQSIGMPALVPDMSVTPIISSLADWARSKWVIDTEWLSQQFSVLNHGSVTSNINTYRWAAMKKNEEIEQFVHLHLHGDALTILNLCTHYYDRRGEIHDIEDHKTNLEQVIENMKHRGLLAIGFACKQTESPDPEPNAQGSCLLAVIGLKYSCFKMLEDFRNAGVSIKLISQDELSIAREAAHKLGIFCLDSNNVELEGVQIRDLNNTERRRKIEQANIMGSCLGEDMLHVVQSLQENGHVVAFFGGLTSDTSALKKADMGITEVTLSTEIARESSHIIISDKSSLPDFLKFGSLMMVMELTSKELISNPPAKRAEPLVTKAVRINIAAQAMSQASLLLVMHLLGKAIQSIDEDMWKLLVFNSFLLCQVFNQLNVMSIVSKEVAISVIHHYWFLLALGAVMAMQVLILDFATNLAGCGRLNLLHWGLSFIISALSWAFGYGVELVSVLFSNWSSTAYGSHLCLAFHFL
ncbi:hypothetical protein JCGZ_18482 [Jatropha curcas]|uniref:Uncharacterized protein n=1 Tax=Jatropha curcas TaxID=180498 RepID=A0A067K4D9_JATCU|nr:hypothetical protein JCGZ_18482 [Jatropha curcas]